MKKLLSLTAILFTCAAVCAQNYKLQWGEDMKIKKGSVDMEIIHADKDGVYFVEGKMRLKSYFVIGATYGTAYKLLKFDRNYSLVYEKEFKRELKGRDFHSIQFMNNSLYLFAYEYAKKEKLYTIYGIRIDPKTGQGNGEMKLLGSFQKESKDEAFNFAFKPTADSTKWMLVGDISNAKHTALSVNIFDEELNKKENTDIRFGFATNTFDLEDVMLTKDNKYLVIGREFEFVESGKKKKRKIRTFKKYSLAKYDKTGNKELDISTEVGDKFTMSGKLIPTNDGKFFLAGFYANTVKKDEIGGVFLNTLDPLSGQVLNSSIQEISNAQLSQGIDDAKDDDDDEIKETKKAKQKAKDDDDAVDFGKSFVIRDVLFNPLTNGFLIISEVFRFEEYTYLDQSYNSATRMWNSHWVTIYNYINSDMLVVSASADGQISRLNYIPKYQVESIRSQSSGGFSIGQNPNEFFAKGGGMPFYSSFTHMLYKDKLYFVFNDHEQNIGVTNQRDKVKSVRNFKRSSAYGLELDLTSGEIKRKSLFSNDDEPILMPRFGFVSGNEMFLPAMRMKALGKTEFKMGKITIK